jgi:hypothetical protein
VAIIEVFPSSVCCAIILCRGRSPVIPPGELDLHAEYRLKAAGGCATVNFESNVSKIMAKKIVIPNFTDALATLAGHQFDVSSAKDGSGAGVKAFQVRKYGCAAEIAAAPDGSTMVLARPGWLLNGQIARLVDKGYQKFLKSPKMEIPATADHLRAIHEFGEELKEAAGATSLYNESLGTTSDRYDYDRVKGRE